MTPEYQRALKENSAAWDAATTARYRLEDELAAYREGTDEHTKYKLCLTIARRKQEALEALHSKVYASYRCDHARNPQGMCVRCHDAG